MIENVRELAERSQAFLDVLPYYILLEDRPIGAPARTRRIHAGFDISLYALKHGHGSAASPDNPLVFAILQIAAETTFRHSSDSCTIEVTPLTSEVVSMPDNKRQIEPWTELRIQITHARGLHEPAGAPEERALKEVQKHLQSLGVKQGKGR